MSACDGLVVRKGADGAKTVMIVTGVHDRLEELAAEAMSLGGIVVACVPDRVPDLLRLLRVETLVLEPDVTPADRTFLLSRSHAARQVVDQRPSGSPSVW